MKDTENGVNPSHTVRRFTPGDIVIDSSLRQLGRVSHYGPNGEPQVVSLEHGHQTSMPERSLELVCRAEHAPERARLYDAEDVRAGMTAVIDGKPRGVITAFTAEGRTVLQYLEWTVAQGTNTVVRVYRPSQPVAVKLHADGYPLMLGEPVGSRPEAVRLAEAVVQALDVPEPERGATAEEWTRFRASCAYRRGFVSSALRGYVRDVVDLESTITSLGTVAENDPANRDGAS